MNIVKGTSLLSFLWRGMIACSLLSACGEEDETTASSGTLAMQGTVTANIHDYAVRGDTLFLKAEGITTPAKDKITYQWTIADPASLYVWGQVIKYTFPSGAENSVTITLSGTADGYYGITSAKTITLLENSFEQTVKGLFEGANTFDDTRDGQTYRYAQIGRYDWMTQNLNFADAGKSYKNQREYDIIFGRLYSWDEATGVCPTGWELPDTTAWNDLGQALNDGVPVIFESYWPKLGSYAAANAVVNEKKLWPYDPNNTKENKKGWNALPAGEFSGGIYTGNGQYGHWWSATPYPSKTDYAYARYIVYNNATFYFVDRHKQSHLSVRCVRLSSPTP
ncbi:MAG: hypothetical protein LBG31_01160 [Prevotellaceae bacterium]|jgi:uncharacterized protein (TIGR02145 family)|nr:hypothetical protein [Prevotellaceae bacterium]